jgi:3-methylcrotonyl-CoA carboxylase alpha subunit
VIARRRFVWKRSGRAEPLTLESRDGLRVTVRAGGREVVVDCARTADGRASAILPSGRQLTGRAVVRPDGRVEAWIGARRVLLELSDPLRGLAEDSANPAGHATEIRARIPGRVVEVRVAAGDEVEGGATLLVLEAMKMQNEIRADRGARISSVECVAGQTVETGAILVHLEPAPEP